MIDQPHDEHEPPQTILEAAAVFSTTDVEAWRALVRNHLINAGNPEDIPGLATDKPRDGIQIVILATTYKPKSLHPKLYDCPFCSHKNKFWDGRVVYCDDHKIRLIGHDCAEHHIGVVAWRRAEEDYNALRRRERFERFNEQAFSLSQKLIGEVSRACREHSGSIYEAARLPATLDAKFPELWSAVLVAVRGGCSLRVTRKVVDYVAVQRQRTDSDKPTPMKNQSFDIHAVRGAEAMLPGRNPPRACFDGAWTLLRRANEVACSTDWVGVSDREFGKEADQFEEDCRAALGLIDDGLQWMVAALVFLGLDNVPGMCRWWNDPDNPYHHIGPLKRVRGGFRLDRGDDRGTEVRLPSSYQVPEFPSMFRLRALLAGQT